MIIGKGREDDHTWRLRQLLQPTANPQAVAPTELIVDHRYIDLLGLRLSDGALGVDADRVNAEVPLLLEQLQQPPPHGWMVVDHHQTDVLGRLIDRVVAVAAARFRSWR